MIGPDWSGWAALSNISDITYACGIAPPRYKAQGVALGLGPMSVSGRVSRA